MPCDLVLIFVILVDIQAYLWTFGVLGVVGNVLDHEQIECILFVFRFVYGYKDHVIFVELLIY